MHKASGALVAEESRLSDATKGMTKLDLRAQELKDMEVARKLQEEEIKVRRQRSRGNTAFGHIELKCIMCCNKHLRFVTNGIRSPV